MIVTCRCGTAYEIESNDPDIVIAPWPHIECKQCKRWIPLF